MKKLILTAIIIAGIIPNLMAISLVWNYPYLFESDEQDYTFAAVYDMVRKNNKYYTIRYFQDSNYVNKVEITRMSEAGGLVNKTSFSPGTSFSPYLRCLLSAENTGSILSVIPFPSTKFNQPVIDDYKIYRHSASLSGTPTLLVTVSDPNFNYLVKYIEKDGNDFTICGIKSSTPNNGRSEIFIRKYEAAGNLLWEYLISPSAGVPLNAVVQDFKINGSYIYAAGSIDTTGNVKQFAIAKIDKNTGGLLWLFKRKNSSLNTICNNFAVTSSGDVIACGSRSDASTPNDTRWLTLKINSNGVEQWNKFYNSVMPNLYYASRDVAYNLKIASDGSITVLGITDSIGEDCFGDPINTAIPRIMKYSSNGTLLWTKNYSNIPHVMPQYYNVILTIRQSIDNTLLISGGKDDHCGEDGFLFKIDSIGTQIGSTIATCVPLAIINSGSTNAILVSGFTHYTSSGCGNCDSWNNVTAKYNVASKVINESFWDNNLVRTNPNPASDSFSIIADEGEIVEHVMIYDLFGKLIKDFDTIPETINVGEFANGTYLVKIKVNGNWVNKKVVIQK